MPMIDRTLEELSRDAFNLSVDCDRVDVALRKIMKENDDKLPSETTYEAVNEAQVRLETTFHTIATLLATIAEVKRKRNGEE